ncbi:unnamed protein product [Blepharisma stoltei]|uniref:Peroxin-12 n=1 Tax=Blepharisma stoltei TaxID=1481888 RepID=A0AAU9JLR1_9CILI|nr:unnamed protein product [Blepharisma stoltei]
MDSFENKEPTFYEMVMQDRLQDMIWQSIKFVLGVFCEKFSVLIPFRYYQDEISSLFLGSLDLYSLLKTNSNFSESFYSLRRIFTSKFDIVKYLVVNYILPLLSKRISSQSSRILHSSHDIIKGIHMISYLYLNFPYFAPAYSILRHKVIRQQGSSSMGYVFIFVLLLIKGLELWVSSRSKPPELTEVADVSAPYKESKVQKGYCGICRKNIVNPAALSVSGYVFCYSCIKGHVDVFKSCPVTGIRADVKNIRKLHY